MSLRNSTWIFYLYNRETNNAVYFDQMRGGLINMSKMLVNIL